MPHGNGKEHLLEEGATDSIIAEDHDHPAFTQIIPSGAYRRGAITFGSAANNQNIIVGLNVNLITYTFKTVLGAPAANNVEVKVQGTLDLSVRKMNEAFRGVVDAANIAYGAGTQPNPDLQCGYTAQTMAIGTVIHPVGSTLVLRFKVGDRTDTAFPTTFTTTTVGSTTTTFTRVFSSRYTVPGGGANINDHIAGAVQTLVPMFWVYDSLSRAVKFDPNVEVIEGASSGTTVYECDLLWSQDEITFHMFVNGLNLSYGGGASAGSQQYQYQGMRVPENAGLYIKVRGSNNAAETIDMKVQVHQYPYGV